MSIPKNYEALIQSLLERSRKNIVDWSETPGRTDTGEFYVAFSRFTLAVAPGEEQDGTPLLIVRILDSGGSLVDSFWTTPGQIDHRKVEELYDLARRKARCIDAAIKEMAEELEKDAPL